MKTDIHYLSYLAQFFLEWKMFQTNIVEKLETRFISIFFFRKSYRLWDNVDKFCTARQATDDDMAHAHCMLDT